MAAIDTFKSLLSTYRTTRNNGFYVKIDWPTELNNDTELTKMIHYYCESAHIPSKNISTSSVRLEHAFFEAPYGISYEPVTLTFYLDENMRLRDTFVNWYRMIYDDATNGLRFYNDYAKNVTIFTIDKSAPGASDYGVEGNYEVTLIGAYPKSIGDVMFNTSGDGQVVTMQVQFVYEKLEEKMR